MKCRLVVLVVAGAGAATAGCSDPASSAPDEPERATVAVPYYDESAFFEEPVAEPAAPAEAAPKK